MVLNIFVIGIVRRLSQLKMMYSEKLETTKSCSLLYFQFCVARIELRRVMTCRIGPKAHSVCFYCCRLLSCRLSRRSQRRTGISPRHILMFSRSSTIRTHVAAFTVDHAW